VKNLTHKDVQIVQFLLKQTEAIGPTKIGQALGHSYYHASGAVMGNLKRLVKVGMVERVEGGLYRLVQREEENQE
jgi:predicted transcriptional regulator